MISISFRSWVFVVALTSLLCDSEARQAESVAFLGTKPSSNPRTIISATTPLKFLKTDQDESDVNEAEATRPKSFSQVPSQRAQDVDPGTCQCGVRHVSPRTARIVMPMHSVLASRFVVPFVPKPVEAKTVGSFEESAARFFPRAEPSSRILSRVLTTLNRRQYTASNTLFGTSICPDEINSKPSKSLSTGLQKSLSKQNGVFSLGGLGGLPFVGEAGMQAFLSHCPQQGKVFIFFGPHVGITEEGAVGKVERVGRSNPSSACGAVVGAYNEIRNGKKKPKSKTSMNYQEEYIVSKLRPVVNKAKKVDDEEAAALVTAEMYRLVETMIMDELQVCWESQPAFWDSIAEVTLFGGVLINRGQVSQKGVKHEDYFQPLMFETWTKPSVEGNRPSRQDLYQNTFGSDPPTQMSP